MCFDFGVCEWEWVYQFHLARHVCQALEPVLLVALALPVVEVPASVCDFSSSVPHQSVQCRTAALRLVAQLYLSPLLSGATPSGLDEVLVRDGPGNADCSCAVGSLLLVSLML